MIKRSLTLCLLIGMSVIFIFNASIELSSWKSPATQRLSSLDDDDSIETNKILSSFKMSEYVFFALLVLQTGCQPLLIKLFMPPTIVRTTVVLSQELSKFILSILILASSVDWQESMRGWTISDAVMAAGIPAVLYVAQNYCNLMATQVLPPVTFVVLNQTKTLSTAWCCFILLGQKQSQIQVMALILLVCSVLVVQAIIPLTPSRYERENSRESKLLEEKQLTIPEDPEEARSLKSEATTSLLATTEKSSHVPASEECIQGSIGYDEAARQLSMGVLPALFASFLSGLCKLM